MSQSETFWRQLELFEAQSRIVDEILQKDPSPPQRLRKPKGLQHKRWTPVVQLTDITAHSSGQNYLHQGPKRPSQSTVDHQSEKEHSVEKSVSQLFSATNSNDGKVNLDLSGEAFTKQDPVSACIDSLYSDAMKKCSVKLEFIKPQWLKQKGIKFSPGAPSAVAVLNSDAIGKCLVTTGQKEGTTTSDCKNDESKLNDLGKKKSPVIVTTRSDKSDESKLNDPGKKTSSVTVTISDCKKNESKKNESKLNDPEKKSPVTVTSDCKKNESKLNDPERKKSPVTVTTRSDCKKDESNLNDPGKSFEMIQKVRMGQRYALRSSRKAEELCSGKSPLPAEKTAVTNSDSGVCVEKSSGLIAQNSHMEKDAHCIRRSRKRSFLCCSEDDGDAVKDKDGGVNDGDMRLGDGGDLPREKRHKMSSCEGQRKQHQQNGRQSNAGSPQTRSMQKQVEKSTSRQRHDSKPQTSVGASGFSRSHGRNQTSKGLMIRHRLRHNKRRVISRPVTLLCSSCKHGFLRSECLLCVSVKTVTHTIIQKAKSCKSKAVTSDSVPVTQQKKSSFSDRKKQWKSTRSVIDKAKHQTKSASSGGKKSLLSESAKQRSPKMHISKSQKLSSAKDRKPTTASNEKLSSAKDPKLIFVKGNNKLSSVKDRTAKGSKLSSLENNISKDKKLLSTKEQTHSSTKSKLRKLSKSQSDSHVDSDSAQVSVIEYHKHLSQQNCDKNQTFDSTKDVFSQLCQLEERAKDYDLGMLQTVMPETQKLEEHSALSKSMSVYSRKSHVGGVWKNIFLEKS